MVCPLTKWGPHSPCGLRRDKLLLDPVVNYPRVFRYPCLMELRRFALLSWLALVAACSSPESTGPATPTASNPAPAAADRKYLLERVDDAAVVQLYADGFQSLPLKQKTLIWHLYQAALAGR